MAKKQRAYTVQPGDDIATVATANGISVGLLKEVNNLKTNSLKVGQTLVVRI
jgi:LysM repeat protein